jgi:pSer/pThr/pTyr-binding forkhead associated (FHA) protein
MGRKPKFVLEHVVEDRFDPIEFIDESRETPLFSNEGKRRRQVASLKLTARGVQLTPMDSLNGVSIRIKMPVRLRTGRRFRIGSYLIEARLNESPHYVETRAELGERLFAKDLTARGELVFIRPDGSDGLRYPVLKKIFIGRGVPGDPMVDIPLLDDNVSRRHASVSPRSSGLKLKNLSTTNGTYVQIQAAVLLSDGDSFRLGETVLRLVSYRGS